MWLVTRGRAGWHECRHRRVGGDLDSRGVAPLWMSMPPEATLAVTTGQNPDAVN
jgi:hypothetical protein